MTPAFVMASLPHLPPFGAAMAAPLGRDRLDARLAVLPEDERTMIADMRHRLQPWREPRAPATRLPEAVVRLVDFHNRLLGGIARIRAVRLGRATAPGKPPLAAVLATAVAAALEAGDARALEQIRIAQLWSQAERLADGHGLDRIALLLLVARWDLAVGWSAAEPAVARQRLAAAARALARQGLDARG